MAIEASSEPIDTIRKRFDREWLLIAVDELDTLTTMPLRGHLIAHSPVRDSLTPVMMPGQLDRDAVDTPGGATYDVRRATAEKPRRALLYLTRSDHRLPERHASAF